MLRLSNAAFFTFRRFSSFSLFFVGLRFLFLPPEVLLLVFGKVSDVGSDGETIVIQTPFNFSYIAMSSIMLTKQVG